MAEIVTIYAVRKPMFGDFALYSYYDGKPSYWPWQRRDDARDSST